MFARVSLLSHVILWFWGVSRGITHTFQSSGSLLLTSSASWFSLLLSLYRTFSTVAGAFGH